MQYSTHNGFINIDISIPDFQVETAIRIGANPCFVMNICPLAAKIGQGHQVSRLALLTFGKSLLFHEVHLPTGIRFSIVYIKREAFGKGFSRLIKPIRPEKFFSPKHPRQ